MRRKTAYILIKVERQRARDRTRAKERRVAAERQRHTSAAGGGAAEVPPPAAAAAAGGGAAEVPPPAAAAAAGGGAAKVPLLPAVAAERKPWEFQRADEYASSAAKRKQLNDFFINALRVPVASKRFEAFSVHGHVDFYTQWSSDELAKLDEDVDVALQDLDEVKQKHPGLQPRTPKDKRLLMVEIDHIWEVQLFARAMKEVQMRYDSGFTLAQIIDLVDVINDPMNLNPTPWRINNAKMTVMSTFLKKYDIMLRKKTIDTNFGNIVTLSSSTILQKLFNTKFPSLQSSEKEMPISETLRDAMFFVLTHHLGPALLKPDATVAHRALFSVLVDMFHSLWRRNDEEDEMRRNDEEDETLASTMEEFAAQRRGVPHPAEGETEGSHASPL